MSIVASPTPTTFNVDGVDYTLSMNFLDPDGNPVSQFITSEGGVTNTTGLVGQFTPPPGTPVITVDKSGPATLSPAQLGDFVISAQNTGTLDAFNATLVDRLPDGPTGGMCTTPPQILSARVFAADGVTTIPGKGPLVQGVDYSLAYDGGVCELTFNALTAASVIGVSERLLITYRAQVDSDSQPGALLTNVAGATQWYNGPASNPGRLTVHAHADRRHRERRGPRGRVHRDGRRAAAALRQDGDQHHHRSEPGDAGDAGRHAALSHPHREPGRQSGP